MQLPSPIVRQHGREIALLGVAVAEDDFVLPRHIISSATSISGEAQCRQ